MQYSEHVDDCQERTDKVYLLLKQGVPLEEALQSAFCLEKELAQDFVGRFFAGMYAEMMSYGQEK